LLRKKPGYPLQSFLRLRRKKGFPLLSLAQRGSTKTNLGFPKRCLGKPRVKQAAAICSGQIAGDFLYKKRRNLECRHLLPSDID
jgi:hypothetical protein